MKLVISLLLPVLSYGLLTPGDTFCDARHNTSECIVTYGGNVYLQVINNATSHRLYCKKQVPSGLSDVFTVKKGSVKIQDELRNRTEMYLKNGTFKVLNVQWEDAGQYNVDIYDENGSRLKTLQITLEVKANHRPVIVMVSAAVGALLLVILISFCIYRKVKLRKQKGAAI